MCEFTNGKCLWVLAWLGICADRGRANPVYLHVVGESNPLVSGVHDRMPVMLVAEDYDRWLDANSQTDELLALLRPYDAKLMEPYAVNRAVNSVKNDNESSIEPIGETALDFDVEKV
jgi:putative SOS response-associated peptidase YedK